MFRIFGKMPLTKALILKLFTLGIMILSFMNQSALSEPTLDLHFKVKKYHLKNGLTVLLHQDKKAPLVNYQTWFRVGSKDDPRNRTGMAHLFEHMMFRETKKRKGQEFISDIESRGIKYNAYTSYDKTVYHFDLPKTELEFIIELEAERMTELAINEKNLALEREIVKEERLMRYDNKPQNIWIDLFQKAFRKSYYKWPVIGYAKDITQTNVEDCKKFYKKFYAPNNAILVISGPIHIGQTQRMIEKYYGSKESFKIDHAVYPIEPSQKAKRVQNLFRRVKTPSLAVAYHAPRSGSPESYSMDILSFILGGSKSSRLYQLLITKSSKAVSVESTNASLHNSGLFIVRSSLHPKNSIRSVLNIINKEISKLLKDKISQEELSRAKVNIMKYYVDSLKTASGKASMLGEYELLFNDYSHLFKELDRYNKVSAESVLKVAQKYLNPHQQTLINLYPKK